MAASGLAPGHSMLLAKGDEDGPDSEREDHPQPEINLLKKHKNPSARRTAAAAVRAPELVAAAADGDRASAPSVASAPSSGERVTHSGPAASHKRHFVRAPYVTPVSLMPVSANPPSAPAGGAVDARSEEISEDGMLVLSPVRYALGATVGVRFAAPTTGEIIAVEATVRWTRDGRGKSALGLEFVRAPPALRRAVAEYIASVTSSVA
jgi:hypothetical protein